MLYIFDNRTARPVRIESENNPGAISEQTVTVSFHEPTAAKIPDFTESELIKRYPKEFGYFRQSNFRAESLPGTPLQGFSLPTTTGERYSRQKGDQFASPVIIAMIDPGVSTSRETIAAVREAASSLPFDIGIIWAFMSSDIDLIESVSGEPRIGETALISARGLARDCGITSFPTLIFTDYTGTVKAVQLGFSKDLKEKTVQKSVFSANR